ncbi:Panacea domain-containing protein [Fusibacter sp. JL216-2]|uniref:Panacea domain-containing protein n=1 Tax=Fusibacter sp. JL216-2 TaxID=3071453 RepID=UPI003D32AB16
MLDVMHVASYFLGRASMTPQKLEKMCYYAQCWALKTLGRKLFKEDIEAWINGPAIAQLHNHFKAYGRNKIPMMPLYDGFKKTESEVLETVFENYGHFSGEELKWLSMHEKPWKHGRENLKDWQASRRILSDESLQSVGLEYVDAIMTDYDEKPMSFGFKLWNFDLAQNEDALNRGGWFQEIMMAMADVTGMKKSELKQKNLLRQLGDKARLLEAYGLTFTPEHREQYHIEEIVLVKRRCSMFGVFIGDVFHIVWFVSEKYKGPSLKVDERINMAMKVERQRKMTNKLFELEKENQDLEQRNRELWDLLDEMTDPKIKKYKQ